MNKVYTSYDELCYLSRSWPQYWAFPDPGLMHWCGQRAFQL